MRIWRSKRNPAFLRLQSKWAQFSISQPIKSSMPDNRILEPLTSKLNSIAPSFRIQDSQIKILNSPIEFYDTLKAKLLGAEQRIFLSTLYIGTTEHELISVLQKSLRIKPGLKLSILTDALRGTRESPSASCASLVAPLVSEFGSERVNLRMYHTPKLNGVRKYFIPKRFNEGWGLQHIKLYGFDDEIIITGANLSNDYFKNRQDRYYIFSSKDLTNYFFQLQEIISKLSFNVLPNSQNSAGYILEWPRSNLAPSPITSPSGFNAQSSKILKLFLLAPKSPVIDDNAPETIVYPIVQLKPLGSEIDISTELPVITSILSTLSSQSYKSSSWTFTTGYFNPTPELTHLFLSTASKFNTVITASPWANGFYGSRGVSGLIPSAYSLLLKRFAEALYGENREKDITLKEWRLGTVGEPGGWTYHAKGLWISLWHKNLQGSAAAEITIIGSSNYTKRSYNLDLEAGVVVFTRSESLKMRLKQERDALNKNATKVGLDELTRSDRKASLKVRIAMWIVNTLGGSL